MTLDDETREGGSPNTDDFGPRVLQVFFQHSEHIASYFSGNRRLDQSPAAAAAGASSFLFSLLLGILRRHEMKMQNEDFIKRARCWIARATTLTVRRHRAPPTLDRSAPCTLCEEEHDGKKDAESHGVTVLGPSLSSVETEKWLWFCRLL